jgi:hypothetical protein
MPSRGGLSRPILGALLLLTLVLGAVSCHSSETVRAFAPTKKFAVGGSSQRLQRAVARANHRDSSASPNADLASLNKALNARARTITKDLTSAAGLLHALQRDFGMTAQQIAKRAGGRPDANPNVELTLTAALATWCLTGPQLVEVTTADRFSSLPGAPTGSVTPASVLVLVGCGFGTAPGSVNMTLHVSGQSVDLPLAADRTATPWDRFQVWVNIPFITGVPDQSATLTLTDNANRTSTLKIPFVALRKSQIFDGSVHGDLVSVNAECFTAATEDSCGGAPVGDSRWPEGRTFVGVHLKSCCRSVDGVDIYSFKLKNGWTSPELDPYVNKEPGKSGGASSIRNDEHEGFTTCWWFGNKRGWMVFGGSHPSPSSDFTFQEQFIWHLDSVCSGVHYAANLVIIGPDGVPYW